jgi:hypothetical protein
MKIRVRLRSAAQSSQYALDERDLWASVLLRGICDLWAVDLRAQPTRAEMLQTNAALWISSNRRTPGSFLWVCSILDLHPLAVRAAIMAPNAGAALKARKERIRAGRQRTTFVNNGQENDTQVALMI